MLVRDLRPGPSEGQPGLLYLGQAVVAITAVLAIGGEYGTGMILVTLTAVPGRSAMLAAKAAILTGSLLVAATIAVLGSVLAGRLLLPGNGFTTAHGYQLLSLTDGPYPRAAVGSVLYLVLIGLLGLGIATAIRDSAVAVGVVLGLLYLFPVLAGGGLKFELAPAPGADLADDRRTGCPGDKQPGQFAHQPVGGPWGASGLGGGSATGWRSGTEAA